MHASPDEIKVAFGLIDSDVDNKVSVFKRNLTQLEKVDDELLGNILEENEGAEDED